MTSEQARDLVLKCLYNAHTDIFNSDDTPVSYRILADQTDFTQSDVAKIVRYLEQKGLVEVIHAGNPFARISAAGIDRVEKNSAVAQTAHSARR